jgi:hypothetical protein
MVKNLPTVERSTKIRFGKNVPDSDVQAENTIIINASNTLVTTPNSGSIYMSPVRFRNDLVDPNIVLMMYNRVTGELSESGESANALVGGQTLEATTDRGNTTSNTVQFLSPDAGIVTAGKVGVSNLLPGHTLSVGSNVYVDDTGSNVLVVSGGVLLDGNLTVNGGVTSITTENLKIKDAIIELGQNNTSEDTTLDLGLIMTRPQSNVTVGFLESSKEIVMGFTESSADSNVITPLTSEDINVHVYGRLYTEANVGILNTDPMHTLDIGSNLYVDEFGSNILVVTGNTSMSGDLTVDTGTLHVDVRNKSIGLGTVVPDANLHVVGNVYVSSNLTVDTDTLHVDAGGKSIGLGTVNPQANLHVVGNVYVSSDLTVDTDTLHVDASGSKVGIKTKSPDAELHVVGNVYVSSNLSVDTDTLHVDAGGKSIGLGTVNPQANLHVVGNVYVSSDLTVDTDTFHVDATGNKVGIKTKSPDAELHVVGNAYVSSNLTVDTDTLHVDSVNKRVGIETKNPQANLHVVGNVYVSSNLTVDTDTFHVDSVNKRVGIETKNPQANLHVVGNVYVSSNLTVDTDTFHVDSVNKRVGIETKNPNANLHVVGNVYVSSNLTVDTDTFHVDSVNKRVGIETKNPTSNLHVVGNAYVTSNTTTDGTLTLNHPTTALITDLTANVEVKLNQLANVVIGGKALANEDMLVYDGSNWTNQLQNHTFLYAKAEETISKGDAVYATGTVGNNTFSIRKAQSNSSTTMPALGLAYQDFALNDQGLIVTFGRADGINTDNFQTGETVYVSNVTAGELSNVKPYGSGDLIQNIGLVVKGHPSTGIVSVTGVGRSNDIPNAPIVADEGDINYVYVNDANNDLKKILPTNLLTQLQTLQQVTDTGNTSSNVVQFTNATTGLVTTSNLQVGSNISVAGLIDSTNKHVPMVGLDGYLEKSPIYFTPGGTYVVSAAEAEFLGNLTLSGNTTILNSESVTISDRIFGVAANNSASGLDSGFMIEHQEGDPLEYANVALIYHADEHRFSISYTQNTFTDQHILHYEDETHLMLIDLYGNAQVRHNLDVLETLDVTGATTVGGDLTVGGASNLFVDVSASRVGINEASPTTTLDVNGDARVQDTTDAASTTTGALVVSGGLGVVSNIHSTNVYAGSHVGVGTNAASAPVHILVSGTGETTNGIYMKSAAGSSTNDAIVNLEVASDGGDAFMTWNASGGAAFAMGLDRSESLLTIANSSSSLNTNPRLRMATDGAVTLTNATNATSKTTGSLILGGGLGVTGDIHATHANLEDVEADSIDVTDTTAATNKTTGALTVAGGVGISGATFGAAATFDGVTSVTNATAATGKTDGALVVTGGVGISGATFGAAATFDGVTSVTNATAATGKTDGALVVTGGVGISGATFGAAATFDGVTSVTNATAATSKTDGALVVTGGVGISGATFGAAATFDGVTSVTNATAATGKTDGALVVTGGVGISGATFGAAATFDGVTSVTNATAATGKTDGALVVTGGVGISGALFGSTADLDGVVTLTDTTEATSSTTGALKAAGGVGIAKDVYVGERAYVTGGLITNIGGVTKKTYSFSNIVTSGGTAPEINVYFTSNVFYSKMTAQLVDDTDEVSTLVLEMAGGGRNGTVPTKNIKVGTKNIFGDASSTPWSSNVLVAPNRIMITPSGALTNSGNCHVFMEYTSDVSSGGVSNVQFDFDQHVINFGY